ncbi:MAG: hypothetical protein K2P99_01830 [Burkholderiales bacterium]|nr:hypothetical protein [Burkholderiales bacterium]
MFPKIRSFLNKAKQSNSKSVIFPLPVDPIATQTQVEEFHENPKPTSNENITVDVKIDKDLTMGAEFNNEDFYDLSHKSSPVELIDENNKLEVSKLHQKTSSNLDMNLYSKFLQKSTLMHSSINEMLDKEIIASLFTVIIERAEIMEEITERIVDYLFRSTPNYRLGLLLNEIPRTEELNNELDTNILINKLNENILQELQKISRNIIINLRSNNTCLKN